ncbi:glycosyltransferase family 4 protein [Patescibacteria group bacterium]|nr:glycosyltransferase family 4 protein [Patescibacteria group bacterium]
MKIAFIGQKGIPAGQGGVEKHVEKLAQKLHGFGHEVFVYSRKEYTGTEAKEFQGIKIVNLPAIPSKNLEAISHTFLATLDVLRQDYDIVHYHGVGPSTLSFIPRLFKRNTKVVATFHCRDQFHQKWGFMARKFLKFGEYAISTFPHKTITVSKILKKFCQEKYNREAAHIPNGVDIVKTNATDLLANFGLEKDNYILTVSRLVKHKGIHCLIDAYKKIETGKKLVIVGDNSYTSDYVKELKDLARDDDRIIFTGLQTGESLAQLFTNASLYVHPSEAEGLPITILEAMNYGLPTLATSIPENIEASGGLIHFFRKGDTLDLSYKMKILLNDKELSDSKTEVAQKYVEETYNWETISLDIEQLYEELMIPRPVLMAKKKLV